MNKNKWKKIFEDSSPKFGHQIDIEYQGDYVKYNTVGATSLRVSIEKKKKISIQDVTAIFLDIHCQLYEDNYLLFESDGSHMEKEDYNHYSSTDFEIKYIKIKDGYLMVEVFEVGNGGLKRKSIFATLKYKCSE